MQRTRRGPAWMPTGRTRKAFGQEFSWLETGPRRDGRPLWKAQSAADILRREGWPEPLRYETHRSLYQIFPRPDSCVCWVSPTQTGSELSLCGYGVDERCALRLVRAQRANNHSVRADCGNVGVICGFWTDRDSAFVSMPAAFRS